MEALWISLTSVSSYIVMSILLALIFVYAFFLRKKKPGALNRLIMGISKKQFKQVKSLISNSSLWFENTKSEELSITAFDNTILKAKYYSHENSTKTIICIHGYLGRYNIDFAQMAPHYYNLGYNVLLLSNRAHGKSGGKFIGFSVKDKHDLFYWINSFDKKVNSTHDIFIHGFSMGAATAMLVSGMDIPNTVKGIISDCGFISPIAQIKYLLKKFFPVALFPLYQFFKLFTKAITGNDFNKTSAIHSLQQAKTPILFIHGKNDFFVPLFMSKLAYKVCASDKYLEIFKNAGHTACQYVDFNRYNDITSNFLNKYSSN